MKSKTKSKKTKPQIKKRSVTAKAKARAKRIVISKRPLHRVIAFHPLSILVILCVGVILSVASFKTHAQVSYNVSAEVPAPALTQPAVITDPTNNEQVSPQTIDIIGTCPYDSYVEVNDNGNLIGSAICTQGGSFSITDVVYDGTNVLTAQDYNVTNSPGPSSPSVTVYYYPPPPTPPPSGSGSSSQSSGSSSSQPAVVAPLGIQVIQVDTDIPFVSPTQTQIVSDQPTLTGTAPPFSLVLVTVHSNPYYCHTYANAQGYWTCSFDQVLPAALHEVYVTAVTTSGKNITFTPFQMKVVPVSPPSKTPKPKFLITANYTYKVYMVNQPVNLNFTLVGGSPPYAVSVDWGDGSTSTYLRQSDSNFTISHTYKWFNSEFGNETVKVEAIDASGSVSSIQLETVLRNPSYVAVPKKPTGLAGFIDRIRPWLILLWPGYAVILLMLIAFWLGEKQEIIQIVRHHKPKPPLQHHGPRV